LIESRGNFGLAVKHALQVTLHPLPQWHPD
jgi:hypothetical protein